MGTMCSTFCLPPFDSGAAPTVRVGESGVTTSGCSRSMARSSAIRASKSASEITGSVQYVVQPVVAGYLLSETLRPLGNALSGRHRL